MPTYEYVCSECGEEYQLTVPRMSMRPERVECKKCGSLSVSVIRPPLVIQKGYSQGDARFNRGRGR